MSAPQLKRFLVWLVKEVPNIDKETRHTSEQAALRVAKREIKTGLYEKTIVIDTGDTRDQGNGVAVFDREPIMEGEGHAVGGN